MTRPKATTNGREKFLSVSTRRFTRYGFERVALRWIAKEALTTLHSIYHYFSNKEDFCRAVEAEIYAAYASSLMAALTSGNAPADCGISFKHAWPLDGYPKPVVKLCR